ncbi:PAS domain-containing hybrid sensor histidine kinase/response regulator [Rhizorhabdus phycosphaerae]|uniref:PAS domain-containing hybrid sensor histidine kinase/response regulator n=1 Tax=Rhizorhabdus phycosphaerae TaxID=2711156 RepID=UPI001D019416|nr:PAS domain-containing hybrid sensor histidine kinase/response regulator [Rhizorhabdus phycosphaerae]
MAGAGHWRSDASRNMFLWSPEIYRILGFAPETQPTVELVRSHYHPDDAQRVALAMQESIRTGALAPFRFRWIRPDGRTIHVQVAGQVDRGTEMIGIMRDVTQEVETERALLAARDQVRATERSKAEMLELLRREVRAPIQSLLSSLDAVRRSPSEAQRASQLAALAQAADGVMAVIDEMLDFTRVDAGRVVIESINFDLRALVRTTADLFNGAAAAKGLTIEGHGLEGEPVAVRGDPARLQQILSNLLGNAVKYTESGTVSLALSPTRSDGDTDWWMMIVRDSGNGIDQEVLGRIFARGEQVDAARLRLHGRSGLGLAISQQLAEAMGGSIAASSEPGKGTTFSIELPFRRSDGILQLSPEHETAGPMRILLAEDNPINRRLMAGLLTREGHDVLAVEDGRKALSAIATQPFDLVLMDMQMPELDGLEATRAIRALDPPSANVPILAISADSAPERRRIYFDAGIDSFLPKPIVSGQLLEMIGTMRRVRPAAGASCGDRFDRERLNLLVERAGYEDAALLMRTLLADLSDRPRRIAAAIRAQAWEIAASEADALRTMLDSFGNFSLSRLLVAIGRQCSRHECQPAVVAELFDQAKALAVLLDQEMGSAPAAIAPAARVLVEPQSSLG